MFAYDFQANQVPGIKPYEELGYWRDVGTIEAYWRAHLDLLGEQPVFDLDNRDWPILTDAYHGPPARVIAGELDDAQVGAGSFLKRAAVRRSILGRNVTVHEGALIEDSVVMDHTSVGKGARLRRVIVDRFNVIGSDQEIGVDPDGGPPASPRGPKRHRGDPRGGRRDYFWRTREAESMSQRLWSPHQGPSPRSGESSDPTSALPDRESPPAELAAASATRAGPDAIGGRAPSPAPGWSVPTTWPPGRAIPLRGGEVRGARPRPLVHGPQGGTTRSRMARTAAVRRL